MTCKGWYVAQEGVRQPDGQVVFETRWFSYVTELDRKVPEAELMRVKVPNPPTDHCEGNTNG